MTPETSVEHRQGALESIITTSVIPRKPIAREVDLDHVVDEPETAISALLQDFNSPTR